MRTSRSAVFLVFAAACFLAAFFVWKHHSGAISGTTARETAFLNAAWGMSPQEVAKANHASLKPTVSSRRFYTPKEGVPQGRYLNLSQEDFHFLGRTAEVNYVFYENKLFVYHVFVKGPDPAVLDKELLEFLKIQYGADFEPVREDSPLRGIWNLRNLIVNYWIFKDNLRVSLQDLYQAGFGVVYRPIENAIKP